MSDQTNHETIVELLAEGLPQRAIARQCGVTQGYVSQVAAAQRKRAERGPIECALDAFVVDSAEMPPERLTRVEVARVLAARLDRLRDRETGAAGIASAAVSREFNRVLDELAASRRYARDSLDELRERRASRVARGRAAHAARDRDAASREGSGVSGEW